MKVTEVIMLLINCFPLLLYIILYFMSSVVK
ncbi:unnamed protein product [Spodoptera exigua]|nr:unnamed protein product [Spodoptera exigua]